MAEEKKLKEALVAYGVKSTDLAEPIILERDGQPVAVILSFEEYRRLQEMAERERIEAEAKWRERFDRLLAEVHSQTARYSSDEIEAEITAAFNEVRRIRYENRSID